MQSEIRQELEVNSVAWWNDYFREQWDAHGGGDQTRGFMRHLLTALPGVEKEWLAEPGRSVLDWGCAFGEGVDEIAKAFPMARVAGVDAAQAAIERARQAFPTYDFILAQDPAASEPAIFDAVITSNCLEHFSDPLGLAAGIARQARHLLAILVPYAESPRMECHLASFDENTLPPQLGDLRRIEARVVEVPGELWPGGRQLLVLYAGPAYLGDREDRLRRLAEREKWDAYYRDLPLQEIDPATAAFNAELVSALRELLPPDAAVLEAGCGGGSQSLALAREGGYRVTLLDFAAESLAYARRLFEREGVAAEFIRDDAFAIRSPQYDLVFNAGVLEHYSAAEQADFLRGMASRSRRYVLVLIPNRACYWYWLWRIGRSAAEGWPFGKEVPLTGLAEVFAAAGLNYLGHAFMGGSWTEGFIQGYPGLDESSREVMLRIHRSGIVPPASRGYLLAALGSVRDDDGVAGDSVWNAEHYFENRTDAEGVAALADALAAALAADMRARREAEQTEAGKRLLDDMTRQREAIAQARDIVAGERDALARERDAARRECDATVQARDHLARERDGLANQLTEAMAELARAKDVYAAHLADMEARLAAEREAHAAGLARLSQEMGALGSRASQAEALVALMRGSLSWRLTLPMRFAARLVRYGLVAEDKRRIGAVAKRLGRRLPLPNSLKADLRRRFSAWFDAAQPAATFVAQAADQPAAAHQVQIPLAAAQAGMADVVVWGVIDWHFRIQRPQHLARHLAASGRRVFYLSNHFVDSPSPGFAIEPLDAEGRLFQVRLHVRGAPAIYYAPPDLDTQQQLLRGMGELLAWSGGTRLISLVQHAFWYRLAASLPNSRLVYDCMDHHEGFGDVEADMLALERLLMADSDLLVVTSSWLDEITAERNPRRLVVRNAGDYAHFCHAPDKVYKDASGRKVIGYFGAIAEWFDTDLVEMVARACPDALVLLIGNDTAAAGKRLQHLPNVVLTGEVGYAELPFYLHGFDVCLMPFKVIPLTLATNPVKIYEYLSAGKPVVAVDLPEMRQFGDLVSIAADGPGFVRAVQAVLASPADSAAHARRQAFASQQTWAHRAEALLAGIESLPDPKVSIIVVTYNNLALTKACLESLERYSDYGALEVIVVDNASSDGTPDFLREWAAAGAGRELILNADNRGFSAANNQGLAIASGEYLVLLNNDTYVTPGWVRTLTGHLRRDKTIGLVGPVTNNIGNEARIRIDYADMAGMLEKSAAYTRRHLGERLDLPTVAFFCVMMPRRVYEQVGPLDEAFGVGFFEDDDYCRRVEQAGWRVMCAEDVFVHHHLSASFDKLKQSARQALFERNKAIYEAKWGAWVPHRFRETT